MHANCRKEEFKATVRLLVKPQVIRLGRSFAFRAKVLSTNSCNPSDKPQNYWELSVNHDRHFIGL